MDNAYSWLRAHKVQHASPGPQRLPDWNKNAGGIRAFYFSDPDGHVLEVLAFPADKGNPKWHRPADKLFLGIDHTAIVISETEASLRFYRDALGFEVVGESEDYGPEQERLNNIFGARLRITAVRAAAGPGIEFLEYLARETGSRIRRMRSPTISSTGKPGFWGSARIEPRNFSGSLAAPWFRPESWNCRMDGRGIGKQSSFAIRTAMPWRSPNSSLNNKKRGERI